MRFLLDTSTCIAAMRGNDNVVRRMQSVTAAQCAISTITAFELFTGVQKCRNKAAEEAKVRLLLSPVLWIEFDLNAAEQAALVRAELESKGQTIGPYDLLLAGQAIALGITLATNNTKEFSRIPALRVEDWTGEIR